MRRPAHRPFSLIRTVDQWRRCAHERTALDTQGAIVELERLREEAEAAELAELPTPAGMAFDRHCRLFRSEPEAGQVRVYRWRPADPLDPLPAEDSRELFAPLGGGPLGEFVSEGPELVGPLRTPTGLAVDGRGQLHLWESGAGGPLVYDLEGERVRSRLQLGFDGPVDLAWIAGKLVAVGPELPGWLSRGDSGHLRLRALPDIVGGARAARVCGDGRARAWLLVDAGTADARILAADGSLALPVAGAGDLCFLAGSEAAEELVVARGPDQAFLRFSIAAGSYSEEPPLSARGYDGRGIVRTPDDRVAYFAERRGPDGQLRVQLRHAVPARLRYEKRGRVTGFRLDAGEFHRRWGRIFIDACVPTGTELRVAAVTSDDPPDPDSGLGLGPGDLPIPRTPPANSGPFTLVEEDALPLPPLRFVPEAVEGRLSARPGRELPWTDPDGELRRFSTWEAPIRAEAGRYLWIFVELRGNSRRTPRLRSIRAEQLGHPLLRRLPKVYAHDRLAADFLWRFLAMFDGALADLELRTALRHAIFDPRSTPASFLPWLGDLLGMSVDGRWPVSAQRTLITEATWLFRFRGTVPGLARMLEIYLDIPVQIVEHFRVRGLGGAIVGAGEGEAGEQLRSGSVLGAGFRVGGTIGSEAVVDVSSEQSLAELGADGFETHAHRFTVIVPASLSGEQREVVEHILDVHRPAHTLFELCTLDAGLRVGVGLYAGLSTIVGLGAGFSQLQVGAGVLGRDGVVGRPRAGTIPGSARVGRDSHVG